MDPDHAISEGRPERLSKYSTGDDAVVVEGRRQSVDALPPSRRPVPLFG